MEEAQEGLIALGTLLFMVAALVGGIWVWLRGKKKGSPNPQRREEIMQLVRNRGWTHVGVVPDGADRYCGGSPLPTTCKNVPVQDHIVGEYRGRTISCFEYVRRDRDVDGPDTVKHFALFTVTLSTSVPRLIVKKPRFGDKVNARMENVFSAGRVMELGDPAFDDTFLLVADEQKSAREILSGPLTRFLMSDERSRDWPLRFQGDLLITSRPGRLLAEHIDQMLDYLCDVVDQLPVQATRTY
ncbi:hypothetical protein ACFV3R_13890 [Streptomyces sp. NPDC059740]|uniref:hypothetical protein n=1 Tax=Streptomyces sp. NPDC059740 TaxID=3346926 RepID=UPI00364F90A3